MLAHSMGKFIMRCYEVVKSSCVLAGTGAAAWVLDFCHGVDCMSYTSLLCVI